MNIIDDDLSLCRALVADGNPNSRAILVSQLREFGVGAVSQASRLSDARSMLEGQSYDVVLCEQYFPNETATGQELLDDLRRNQLLPFGTVFIMVTGEATYSRVAEAAESALDGYLLKPHKANELADRLRQSRIRKASLQDIFAAIEWEEFEQAADMCLERYEARGMFWLYAARVGAELLMRIGRFDEAQVLYEAIVAAKTLPWAKLGVARALMESGQTAHAVSALEALVDEDPTYADAYDVMGRAHFELGNLDKALATYKMASDLTPNSVSRLQKLASMTFYTGDVKAAEKLLDRATTIGLDSKMFDSQTLVILAFTRLDSKNRKGLQRCRDDFTRLLERSPGNPRLMRQVEVIEILRELMADRSAAALARTRAMNQTAKQTDFDFEASSNLASLCAQLGRRKLGLGVTGEIVESLAMRFCTNRSLTEMLAGSAQAHPGLPDRIREAGNQIMKISQDAVSLAMRGDPSSAVQQLLIEGQTTLNAKLIETAYQLLQRYQSKVLEASTLSEAIETLRSSYSTRPNQAKKSNQTRQAGGLQFRASAMAA
jgi:tetratricopeptide (TPR) repeat protein